MNNEDELKVINKFLRSLTDSDYLVVVEGPKDRASLEALGVGNEIYCFHSQKSLQEKLREIKNKRKDVVILTDFDKEGNDLFKMLYKELTELQVNVISRPREMLAGIVSHIEGLYTRYENLLEKL